MSPTNIHYSVWYWTSAPDIHFAVILPANVTIAIACAVWADFLNFEDGLCVAACHMQSPVSTALTIICAVADHQQFLVGWRLRFLTQSVLPTHSYLWWLCKWLCKLILLELLISWALSIDVWLQMHIHIEVGKLAFLNTDLFLNLRLLEPSLGNWLNRLRGHFKLCRTFTILLRVDVVVVDKCLEVSNFYHLALFAFVFD